jgi:hypothetical protein
MLSGRCRDSVGQAILIQRLKEWDGRPARLFCFIRYGRDARASAPESAHQQWGGSPHRTEHWLSVAEGNCVAERRGGKQPEANDQSIIKKMINSIRPDALASLLVHGEAQNGSRPGKGERQLRDLTCGKSSERRDRSAWGGWR